MEKPELYVKNEKGRYEPYREPEPPFSNCLYRKVGNKYEPCSMLMTEDIGEGVWVVTKHTYGKNYATGKYLRDMFMCQKASDIQDVSLAKLGGMDKLADYLCTNWGRLPKNKPIYDICRAVVGILFEYEKKEKDGK